MAIAKLKLLEIEFPQSATDEVLMKLINTDDFHPELASKFTDSVQGLTALNRDNPYADIIARMDEASNKYKIDLTGHHVSDTKLNIIQADTYFCNIMEQINEIEKVRDELQVMLDENESTMAQLQHMISADVNFDELFSCKYLQIRFGRIPSVNLDKLKYYGTQEFLFKSFYKDPKDCYCMYITTDSRAPEIDNIFSSLYFERIHIPEFVHGTPEEALEVMKEEDTTAKSYLVTLQERIDKVVNESKEELVHIYNVSKRLNQTYEAQKYVVVFGANEAVYGFTEEKKAKQLKEDFEQIEDVHVEIKPAMGDSRLTPPTKLKNNIITRPFKMFVEMYGVPSYTDFDPTNLFAISYTLLFGIMFGDVGQGLLLSLVGFIFWKWKKMELGAVGMRIGISSAIFGIVFGSVFGSEEILHPFFMPMANENTLTLLIVAVSVGVALIIVSIIFNIIINIKKKNWGTVLFSQNGLAGLVFYTAVIMIVANMMLPINLSFSTIYIAVLIVVPVILMFLQEPLTLLLEKEKMFPHGFGGFFTEAFFEMFEVMLTFIANTMSFLRVGGFVLSHAGMMMVVFTLANMIGGVGYWIALVLGNIFVMCLEGLIVGIQVLRLEFYEMFSRYYSGDGKPFITIKDQLNIN